MCVQLFLSNMQTTLAQSLVFKMLFPLIWVSSSMSQTLNKIKNVELEDQILESWGLSNAKTFQRDLHDPKSHSLKTFYFSNIFSYDKLCDAVAAICQSHTLGYLWLTTEILSGLLKKMF